MKDKSPEKKSIVYILAGVAAWIFRLGFEWALPVYSLFAFSWPISLTIWALFIFWQLPLSIYLVGKVKEAAKETEETEEI